jgi:hypothetical protein
VLNRIQGVPVHTNWPFDATEAISTLYVCESPSNREFSHGLPSVGLTGQAIYKNEHSIAKLPDCWLDTLDGSVYRTNLVRCQADAGLQKRVDREKKMRVNEAAQKCILHLQAELSLIAENKIGTELHVVVAIGAGFSEWVKMVKKMAKNVFKDAGVMVKVTQMNHPSAPR